MGVSVGVLVGVGVCVGVGVLVGVGVGVPVGKTRGVAVAVLPAAGAAVVAVGGWVSDPGVSASGTAVAPSLPALAGGGPAKAPDWPERVIVTGTAVSVSETVGALKSGKGVMAETAVTSGVVCGSIGTPARKKPPASSIKARA